MRERKACSGQATQTDLRREDHSQTPGHGDDLNRLTGAAFELAFAQKMIEGHRRLIVIIQEAQPRVQNAGVRALLDG